MEMIIHAFNYKLIDPREIFNHQIIKIHFKKIVYWTRLLKARCCLYFFKERFFIQEGLMLT
jgi:hypothetical protein